jgi:hypothetical protein
MVHLLTPGIRLLPWGIGGREPIKPVPATVVEKRPTDRVTPGRWPSFKTRALKHS